MIVKTKNCMGCPHAYYCWDEHWETGSTYCYRDKEDIVVYEDSDLKG